jgi:hypothetical protein
MLDQTIEVKRWAFFEELYCAGPEELCELRYD